MIFHSDRVFGTENGIAFLLDADSLHLRAREDGPTNAYVYNENGTLTIDTNAFDIVFVKSGTTLDLYLRANGWRARRRTGARADEHPGSGSVLIEPSSSGSEATVVVALNASDADQAAPLARQVWNAVADPGAYERRPSLKSTADAQAADGVPISLPARPGHSRVHAHAFRDDDGAIERAKESLQQEFQECSHLLAFLEWDPVRRVPFYDDDPALWLAPGRQDNGTGVVPTVGNADCNGGAYAAVRRAFLLAGPLELVPPSAEAPLLLMPSVRSVSRRVPDGEVRIVVGLTSAYAELASLGTASASRHGDRAVELALPHARSAPENRTLEAAFSVDGAVVSVSVRAPPPLRLGTETAAQAWVDEAGRFCVNATRYTHARLGTRELDLDGGGGCVQLPQNWIDRDVMVW